MRVYIVCLLLALMACKAKPASSGEPRPSFAAASPEAKGEALFSGKGRCSSCHSLAEGVTIVGPSLAGIASIAASRVEGMDAKTYLVQSVLRPDAYRPPGFEQKLMDSSLAKSLSSQELDDIVAYLLSLN